MSDKLRSWHKRLPEFAMFDEVRLHVDERWKESGLSGDEWRFSVSYELLFKGVVLQRGGGWHDMRSAISFMSLEMAKVGDHGISNKALEIEKEHCDQPSCLEKWTRRFWLKRLFSDRGEMLDPSEMASHRAFRRFCERHSHRGDCSREDCDSNYVEFGKDDSE